MKTTTSDRTFVRAHARATMSATTSAVMRALPTSRPRDARCAAKRSSIEPRVVSRGGRPDGDARGDDAPTPLSDAKRASLPPEMMVDDPWESESFDGLGNAMQNALVAIAVVSAVAGFYATSTYNDGAVEVDFQSYKSPEEAVADTLRKVNALQSAPSVEAEASGEASGEVAAAVEVAAAEPESS